MNSRPCLTLGMLLGVVGLLSGLAMPLHSQQPAKETFNQRVARTAKTREEDVNRVLRALGPAVREELSKGRSVDLPGLGTFRIVRIAEHRDLRNGRPVTIPAVNHVEFVGGDEMDEAANGPDAVPAETVPAFQFIPLTGQTPGQYTPRTRVPPVRTR
jgi:nucleoid DNA-binding protein